MAIRTATASQPQQMIPLNDFKRQWADLRRDALDVVESVGSSGWYILGSEVSGFEREVAAFCGSAHAVGVANGMDAIEIGLRCVGVTAGSRVLTTPLSAFATTLAIVRAGAIPVFVDIDEYGQIDAQRSSDAAGGISALLPVHLFGIAAELPALRDVAGRAGARIVEDCAQAIGASSGDVRVGSVGDVSATSFYPTKNLGAMGDGGALFTNDPAMATRAATLRNYGQSAQYVHEQIGLNSRLDELQAAILRRAMLPRLPAWTERRRQIARRYQEGIQSKQVRVLRGPRCDGAVWHLFPVFVDPQRRRAFRSYMSEQGVATGIHYPTIIPDQVALRQVPVEVKGTLERARHFAASEVSLPIHPYLTDEEANAVIAASNRWPG
jgi:dTDP-3-amino-3,4,6-trideoxy-alpha-D-glucose transaminase